MSFLYAVRAVMADDFHVEMVPVGEPKPSRPASARNQDAMANLMSQMAGVRGAPGIKR